MLPVVSVRAKNKTEVDPNTHKAYGLAENIRKSISKQR